MIMASTEGGVEIEEVAARSPEKILKVWVDPTIGLRPFQARRLAFGLGFEGNAFKQAVQFIQALYRAYEETDSSLAEINPLVLTKQGDVVAVDARSTWTTTRFSGIPIWPNSATSTKKTRWRSRPASTGSTTCGSPATWAAW